MNLSQSMPTWAFLHGDGRWIIQVFVIVFFTLCIDFIQKRVLNRFLHKLQRTRTVWDHTLIEALQPPIKIFIWIIGISFSIQIIEKETEATIFMAITPLRTIGMVAVIAWFLMRFVKRYEKNILAVSAKKGKKIDLTTLDAISKIVRGSIIITCALVVLQTLGFSVSGLLAFGGIGGIAIGFAAKDLLSNFFGGFMLYWDRPFKVGDWIRSPDRNIEGTVEHIGWRLTRIRTFDKRPLYVPNSIFATISVENPSRMLNRRIWETIGVRYEDVTVVPVILQAIRKMLHDHPEIDQERLTMVYLNTYGAYSLDFFVYAFTRTTDWAKFHEIKEDVLLKIYDIISQFKAKVAVPTSRIHLSDAQGDGEGVQIDELAEKLKGLKTPSTP